MRYGALAPPVGLAGSPPFEPLSLDGAFSFSADAPPAEPTSLEPSLLGSLVASAVPASLLVEEPSPVVLVVFVDVVLVDVVCTAAFSALVSVGGVMSGVLLGTASETLLPPQAPSAAPLSNAMLASTAGRAARRILTRLASGC
jgi:hypothetical protein